MHLTGNITVTNTAEVVVYRYNSLVRKRPLGRPRRRWEDNIRMELEEIGISAGNWVDSAQDINY